MRREINGGQFPHDELAQERAKRAAKIDVEAKRERGGAMLKRLSPEARKVAQRVAEGMIAEAELKRIHAETEALEKSIRRSFNNLSQALSAGGNVFPKCRDEVRKLIHEYQARPGLNEDDLKFVRTVNEHVDRLEDDYRARQAVREVK